MLRFFIVLYFFFLIFFVVFIIVLIGFKKFIESISDIVDVIINDKKYKIISYILSLFIFLNNILIGIEVIMY